ncbi:hypothetical protein LZ30DRAFT_790491 [Colletotrichum cereale]|nr:hypothetical protein LZ30DRAFT_790491 [Colletotrichum cereale]
MATSIGRELKALYDPPCVKVNSAFTAEDIDVGCARRSRSKTKHSSLQHLSEDDSQSQKRLLHVCLSREYYIAFRVPTGRQLDTYPGASRLAARALTVLSTVCVHVFRVAGVRRGVPFVINASRYHEPQTSRLMHHKYHTISALGNTSVTDTRSKEKMVSVNFLFGATAHHGIDYLTSDELIGWKYYPSTKDVDILTHRPDDGSKRLVPERLIQQRSPSQLYAYWMSFARPREKIIQTDQYHVFDIIDENPSRGLKVQWVGYSPSDSDTTWEPVSKIRDIAPKSINNYVIRKQFSEGHSDIRKPVETSKSDITH